MIYNKYLNYCISNHIMAVFRKLNARKTFLIPDFSAKALTWLMTLKSPTN